MLKVQGVALLSRDKYQVVIKEGGQERHEKSVRVMDWNITTRND